MNRILSTLFAALGLASAPVAADAVILSYSDPIVDLQAELTISGDTLTVVLSNNSPFDSKKSVDLLTSFYFDIVNGGNRPTLAYESATGDVFTDNELLFDDADLVGDTPGEDTWQFKQALSLIANSNSLTFGIGTVGNKKLDPNGFDKDIVHRDEYGIYAGDVIGCKLDGAPLVKTSATFTFSGLTGFTEEHISEVAMFGLGTKPDTVHLTAGGNHVPEPSAALLLGMGLVGLVWAGRARRI